MSAVLSLGERHKIPFLKLEGFEHLSRDDHLAPLSHASNPLLNCGCFSCHAFRLSDCQNLSRSAEFKC